MTIADFEKQLAAAQNDRECAQLLCVELPQMESRLTQDQRDRLAGNALAKRIHFSLTSGAFSSRKPDSSQAMGQFRQEAAA